MVDGVDPTGSEGVLAACVDKVEFTEDDSVDGCMDKVCNFSRGVVLARPSAWDSVPTRLLPRSLPRPPPSFYPRPHMSAVEYINMLVQVYEKNKKNKTYVKNYEHDVNHPLIIIIIS